MSALAFQRSSHGDRSGPSVDWAKKVSASASVSRFVESHAHWEKVGEVKAAVLSYAQVRSADKDVVYRPEATNDAHCTIEGPQANNSPEEDLARVILAREANNQVVGAPGWGETLPGISVL